MVVKNHSKRSVLGNEFKILIFVKLAYRTQALLLCHFMDKEKNRQ